MFSYACLEAVIPNLDFVKRQSLHCKFPSIRKCEEKFGYRFGKIMVMETSQVVFLLGPLLVVFRLSSDRKSTEIHYSDMRIPGQQVFKERKFKIDKEKLSVKEAARKWVEYYLKRPGTRIERLELKESPTCIQHCTSLKVDTLLLWCQPSSSISTWFPSTIAPKIVRTEWENMLEDVTVKNAEHFQWRGSRKLSVEQLMALNCRKVELFCHVDSDVTEGYCRAICRLGRRTGYGLWMRSFEMEKLEKLVKKLEERRVEEDKRVVHKVSIGPFTELRISRNAEKCLVLEVEAKDPERFY